MSRFQAILDRHRKYTDPRVQQLLSAVERYLDTGDPASTKLIAGTQNYTWMVGQLVSAMSRPGALDDQDRKLILLLAHCDMIPALVSWVQTAALEDDGLSRVLADVQQAGFSFEQVDALSAVCSPLACGKDGKPTVIGQRLLAMDPTRFKAALLTADKTRYGGFHYLRGVLGLFLAHSPGRIDEPLNVARGLFDEETLCLFLLNAFGNRFESLAAECAAKGKAGFNLLLKLAEVNPQRFAGEAAKQLETHLSNSGIWTAHDVLPMLGPLAVMPYVQALNNTARTETYADTAKMVISNIAKHGKDQAKPGLLAIMEKSDSPILKAAALEHLIEMKDLALHDALEAAIEKGMEREARDAARFAVLAAQFAGGRLRERLWQDLAAKSKLRRDAAAEALAAGDPQALDRAAGMLAEKSKDARWGAVLLLGKLKMPDAIDCLLNWLPREETEEVRDAISRALREAGVGLETIVSKLGPIDLPKLRQQGEKLRLPVEWLGENDLPEIKMRDAAPLGASLVRFLLHRQSRQKEPIVDPEAAPLYALIDRKTSGDFAFKLLTAFLEAEAPKADAWAMITAGVLGDNRVITTLATKVRGWAQDFAQKLGEWGIEALALNGSDAALMAVESIATKFKDNPRRKFKVIGDAAQNAIELAAKRLGITMDELGDRIVPTLGFEPGRPRRIEAGKRVIEATIGMDFKLSMKDAETGKRAVSIPKTAAPEVVAEFKGLGKLLLEVAKSQATRLENLMVLQRRWPAKRWRELFLEHPILFPFAVRLVWGTYSPDGKIRATFCALPDRSLTDSSDESVDVPADDTPVGIVHPLDLTDEQLSAWRSHLADYEIEPPLPQMDRPVMRVTPEQRELKIYDELKGSQLNALSFRSKSERSGWSRGPVGDGAMVASYRKRFAGLGIEAYVTVDGLPVYTDPTVQVTIGSVLFIPIDTTPRDFQERLMTLGDVPAMAFSEAVGDMTRICGRMG